MITNTSLFETLEKIKPIESAFASTHNMDDKYSRIFRLIFRFKDTLKEDTVYKRLQNIITKFVGNTEWVMKNSDKSNNYIIVPKYFYEERILKDLDIKNLNNFDKIINDKAIADLPFLIEKIKNEFNIV
ncbi:hypothetical protein [Chryseobacterium mucoviscidosis]|uniref:Uncharacterized protein n=1 Tax=Chryseobacterium mucoviscidosis TaxID=1945581 RepID=A0A202BTA1_9FLAO|nr:hypothetical protein [Chryseobacterium mucoviscidosis]OVE54728.1 hypothetical protein B0E34_18065 [Chryseobacterium mucoviscidosis]